MDYICDLKADLYAMTETWLTENDASVRVELIPDGCNLLDQPRPEWDVEGVARACYTTMTCVLKKWNLVRKIRLNSLSGSSVQLDMI